MHLSVDVFASGGGCKLHPSERVSAKEHELDGFFAALQGRRFRLLFSFFKRGM